MTARKPTDDVNDELRPFSLLRQPFTGEAIGKLPRLTCRDCKDSQYKVCSSHTRQYCELCKQTMSSAHMHLDYVGHAEVTDRLLEADPFWDWDFLSRDVDPSMLAAIAGAPQGIQAELLAEAIKNSPPHFERDGKGQPIGLWITLTVAGMTRKGFGSVESNKYDAEKQLIGDALRNAAMRFGVALTLWSKGLLESEQDDDDRKAPTREAGSPARPPAPAQEPSNAVGNGAPPPIWREYGYADEDEFKSLNDSLRDVLHAVGDDHKAPIREWLVDHGYTTEDPETGEVKARPLPVRRADVAAYREILIAARDASSRAVAGLPANAANDAPNPMAGEPTMDEAITNGGSAFNDQIPKGIPEGIVDDVIAEVKTMKRDELREELDKLGKAKTGNVATLGQRLTIAKLQAWHAEHMQAQAS